MRTSELTGAALDWAVAKAIGEYKPTAVPRYSTDWAQGGPIIEQEKIAVIYEPSLLYDDSCRWKALAAMSNREHEYGPTPLIAAMRCYVASKLGDEVELPEGLADGR